MAGSIHVGGLTARPSAGRAVIDIKRLRDDDAYRNGVLRKRVDPARVAEVLAADEEWRALETEVQTLRAEQNAVSKEIRDASPEERPAKIAAANERKDGLRAREASLSAAEARVRELALQIPNPAHESVPDGGE